MADLSAYVDFSVKLDKSDPDNPVTTVTDISDYPMGVAPTITGVISATQPDGISRDGSFLSPDISWDGSELTPVSFELRLASDDSFQNGLYTFTYTVKATGYDDTVKTKTFSLDFTVPVIAISSSVDVFTPSLTEEDVTDYVVDGFEAPDITRAWTALIRYVGTSIGTVTGTQSVFDMAYGGYYYDAHYSITLVSTVTWESTTYDWVTVVDEITGYTQIDAYAPPTLAEIRVMLDNMKSAIEAGTWCGICRCDCGVDYTQWVLAVALYDQIVAKCENDEHDGLFVYIAQLLKIITCGVYTQTHTNTIISAYDCGSDFISCGAFGVGVVFITGADLDEDNIYLNDGLAQLLTVFYNGGQRYLILGTEWDYVRDDEEVTIGIQILFGEFTDTDYFVIAPNAFCDDGGGGGGGGSALGWVKLSFVVGDAASVNPAGYPIMVAGDTVYTIPHGIVENTESVLYNDADVDRYPSFDFNYQIAYNALNTVISFSSPVAAYKKVKINFERRT